MKKNTIFLFILICVTLLAACSNSFEMKDNGSLYYSGSADNVEIPREFDGEAHSFSDTNSLRGKNFRYDGTLAQLLKYHAWVFSQNYRISETKIVYCSDYCIEFDTTQSELGVEIVERNNEATLIHFRYRVLNKDGDTEVAVFESLSDLRSWLQ
ncbi:MAG: hypothetical protein J6K89_02290 [Oscillospiraceae bacterium]|nr:hypothetical protein [Oscillospiraceae bacterium]